MSRTPSDTSPNDDSPIERFLDELTVELRDCPARELRHLLAETEAHLRDDAEAAVAAGLEPVEAEREAVRRIGPVGQLARAERSRQRLPLRVVSEQVFVSAGLLGGLGAVAIGISGVVAAVIRAVGGPRAVIDSSSNPLLATNCARWLAGQPAGTSCHDAAVADWAAETVYYRIALGVLGLFAIAAVLTVRRRLRTTGLPAVVTNTIATVAFGGAAIWTLGMGVDAMVRSSGYGWGQWFSATLVAAAGAVIFGMRLVRELRDAPAGVTLAG